MEFEPEQFEPDDIGLKRDFSAASSEGPEAMSNGKSGGGFFNDVLEVGI